MQLQVKVLAFVLQFCVWMSVPKYGPVEALSPHTEMLCNVDLFTKAAIMFFFYIIRLLQFVPDIFMRCVRGALCVYGHTEVALHLIFLQSSYNSQRITIESSIFTL